MQSIANNGVCWTKKKSITLFLTYLKHFLLQYVVFFFLPTHMPIHANIPIYLWWTNISWFIGWALKKYFRILTSEILNLQIASDNWIHMVVYVTHALQTFYHQRVTKKNLFPPLMLMMHCWHYKILAIVRLAAKSPNSFHMWNTTQRATKKKWQNWKHKDSAYHWQQHRSRQDL